MSILNFINELKHRKIGKTLVIYLGSGWVVLEAVNFFVEKFNLNPLIFTVVFFLLIAGLPVTLIIAWFQGSPDRKTTRKERIFYGATALAAVALIVWVVIRNPLEFNKPKPVDKSIAVLPFTNLSNDSEQDYFANGMMEETLNHLAKIRDLRVTSRTSSMVFKDSKLSLKEIAATLGVAHILEGSVQRSGNKIRITVQLIEALSDVHLWSHTFDRELNDVFSIQTEIAKNIARELSTTLTHAEITQLEYVPTTNREAFDFYLRANEVIAKNRFDSEAAVELYDKAIEHDPDFVLAYIKRAEALALWYYYKWTDWEDKDMRAKSDLLKAKELRPGLPETKICEAMILFMVEFKNEEALAILDDLETTYPNNAKIYYVLAEVQRFTGLFKEALDNHEKAIMLDPTNTVYFFEAGRMYMALRNYSKAIEYTAKQHEAPFSIELKEFALFYSTGNPEVFQTNGWWRMFNKRDFKGLLARYDTTNLDKVVYENDLGYTPQRLNYARVLYYSGNHTLARKNAEKVIAPIREKINQRPGDFRYYAALGKAYAFAGNCEEAIIAGKKACNLMPLALDPCRKGVVTTQDLIEVYISCDKYDLAMDNIESLLTTAAGGFYSIPRLRVDPQFDKLRDLPRFQKILETEYKIEGYN